MANYEKVVFELSRLKCPTCHGSGECDDASFGDISYNTWTCTDCKGNGWKGGNEYMIVEEKENGNTKTG